MKSKNDVLAALYTIGIIGVFTLVCWMIRDFPNLTWWITTGLVSLLVFMVFIYPLWDTIKYELDKKDGKGKEDEYSPNKEYWEGLQAKVDADNEKKKREARLKKMMKKDEELRLYDLDMDENDKAQIG
jgi:hypothetical protein